MSRYEFVVPKVAVGDNPRIVVWTEGDLMRIQVYPEYEDVTIELSGSGAQKGQQTGPDGKEAAPTGDWSSDGVTLPEFTELKFTYDAQNYEGVVHEGQLTIGETVRHKSPSGVMMAAVRERTGKSVNVNGWNYVMALLPGAKSWVLLGQMRTSVKRRI